MALGQRGRLAIEARPGAGIGRFPCGRLLARSRAIASIAVIATWFGAEPARRARSWPSAIPASRPAPSSCASERRLYYVIGDGRAIRYPVGVGRAEQAVGRHDAHRRQIREARLVAAGGGQARQAFIAGRDPGRHPRNPMGAAALTLAGGEYAIHGTNAPGSVGGFVSYGCIRMFNQDVVDLYGRVSVGTTVIVMR